MKKQAVASMALLAMVTMSGCGDDEVSNKGNKEKQETTEVVTKNTSDNNHDEVSHDHEPTEPNHDEVCAFCNMKIYGSGDVMGAFTAQAITADGEKIFFDDSGCLLNAKRQAEKELIKSWVRDLETMEWHDTAETVIVKANIQTPMKYGYAFFKTQEAADRYVSENADIDATLTDWTTVDEVAHERYKMKMEKMKQGEHGNSSSESNSLHSEQSKSGH